MQVQHMKGRLPAQEIPSGSSLQYITPEKRLDIERLMRMVWPAGYYVKWRKSLHSQLCLRKTENWVPKLGRGFKAENCSFIDIHRHSSAALRCTPKHSGETISKKTAASKFPINWLCPVETIFRACLQLRVQDTEQRSNSTLWMPPWYLWH